MEKPMTRRIWRMSNNHLMLWDSLTAMTAHDRALTITTDASSSGWGASCGTLTLDGRWSQHQTELSSNWREMRTVILALQQWTFIRGVRVLCLTDNSTTMAVINARRPTADGLKLLAQQLSTIETARDVEVVALHLPGKLNGLSDALSRMEPTWIMPNYAADMQILPPHIQQVTIKWGINTPSLPRHTPCPPPTLPFAVLISTPDIPFLTVHLRRWVSALKPIQR